MRGNKREEQAGAMSVAESLSTGAWWQICLRPASLVVLPVCALPDQLFCPADIANIVFTSPSRLTR